MNNLEKARLALSVKTHFQPTTGPVVKPNNTNPTKNMINGLAAQIKVERKAKGWTQRDLARASGYSQGTITRLENKMWVSIYALFSIVEALGKKITLT